MMIATIGAISFVLGATVAYLANRYPVHREFIETVGGILLICWAVHSSTLYGQDPKRTQAPALTVP